MKRAVGLALVLLIGLPALAGITVAELERRAATSILPEERMAAAYALVDYYAENKTEAELLAMIDEAPETLQKAASLALGELWLAEGKTELQLVRLLVLPSDAPVLVKEAAVPAYFTLLMQKYIDKFIDGDDLAVLYKGDYSEQAQYAAAKVYFTANRGKYDTADKLLPVFEDEDATPGFLRAAADLLSGLYQFPPTLALSMDQLKAIALEDDNPYIRHAAAMALSDKLRSQSAEALIRAMGGFIATGFGSAEYRWAYAYALGAAWAKHL